MSSKAVDTLYGMLFWISHDSGRRLKQCGPGQYVLSLPDKTRNILKELKSDDLRNLRPDLVYPLSYDEAFIQSEKEQTSKLKMEFDRKVLGHV